MVGFLTAVVELRHRGAESVGTGDRADGVEAVRRECAYATTVR